LIAQSTDSNSKTPIELWKLKFNLKTHLNTNRARKTDMPERKMTNKMMNAN